MIECWTPSKYCPDCATEKPVEEFAILGGKSRRRGELFAYCTPCANLRHKKFYHSGRKKIDKESKKDASLRFHYGITLEDYDGMLAAQGGVCAICGGDGTKYKKGFHVDHDHEMGQVRAILCSGCNVGLGCYGDDAELLRLAADYLDRHKTPVRPI